MLIVLLPVINLLSFGQEEKVHWFFPINGIVGKSFTFETAYEIPQWVEVNETFLVKV